MSSVVNKQDFWTWMAYCETVGQHKVDTYTADILGSKLPQIPPRWDDLLLSGSSFARKLFDEGFASHSPNTMSRHEEEACRTIGKLWLCERMQRLQRTMDGLERLTGVFKPAKEEVILSATLEIVREGTISLNSLEDRFFVIAGEWDIVQHLQN